MRKLRVFKLGRRWCWTLWGHQGLVTGWSWCWMSALRNGSYAQAYDHRQWLDE